MLGIQWNPNTAHFCLCAYQAPPSKWVDGDAEGVGVRTATGGAWCRVHTPHVSWEGDTTLSVLQRPERCSLCLSLDTHLEEAWR